MNYDQEKVDEMTLALLHLVLFEDEFGMSAWKSFDWDTMNRLAEKGFIGNPKSKAKSVAVSKEGAERARELFEKHFGK